MNGFDKKTSNLSICFVAHNAYGEISGSRSSGHIGGIERQMTLMARWFAAHGYRVSMLTWDEGQADGIEIDGVRVFKMCARDAGIKGLRFFYPKWTSLIRAMRRADADVYYQNCGEYVTGQVALWCRRNGRKFIYSVANDPDCDPRLPEMHTIRERILYRYGLTHADTVIVQTQRQQAMLQEGFGIESIVVPMPCPAPTNQGRLITRLHENDSGGILWIGRIAKQKRPDRLLEIARALPELRFDLVGPLREGSYSRQIIEEARQIKNVVVHGAVSRNRVDEFYRQSSILCCTSDYEGFPNTFLEAWSHGLPIVSTFDPDNVIVKHGLGVVAEDVAGLINGIRMLVSSPEMWNSASKNARRYYLENHTLEAVMPKFERILQSVVENPGIPTINDIV